MKKWFVFDARRLAAFYFNFEIQIVIIFNFRMRVWTIPEDKTMVWTTSEPYFEIGAPNKEAHETPNLIDYRGKLKST